MKEKLCNLLKILIQILYFILLIIGYFYILDKFQFRTWLVLEPNIFYNKFFKSILIIFLIERVAYVISVIFHELGHLIFGIKANLKFKKFTIFMLSISYNDNKIKFQLKKNKSDLLGACFMSFEKDRLYNKSEIILCFIGGIVFNLLLLFGFIILLFYSNNIYFDIVCVFFIIHNIYMPLYNSIPFTTNVGITTDMLKLIYCLKDPNYIKTLTNLSEIQKLLDDGIEYKNIDENLFIYSKKFVYPSDILMAHFYIARLTSMEEYDKVISYSKRILKDAKKLLTKSDINLIKVQAINCAFDNKKNYELIREWWNNDFNKFMEIMQNINPTYLYINYVYLLRVINDKKKAKVLLDKFYMNEGKYSDKKNISYIKEKIIEVNKDDV